LGLIRERAKEIDGFIATSRSYAAFMSDYFAVPAQKIHVVLPGINLKGHAGTRPSRVGEPFTVGYFARICPEKDSNTRSMGSSPYADAGQWLGYTHRAGWANNTKRFSLLRSKS
jgi:hypothetical protein